MNDREGWEHELTRVIDIARRAGTLEVVVAIQEAIGKIHYLKRDRAQLTLLRQILQEKVR